MKKLYLDHHILVNEKLWPILREIVDRRLVRLALSSWNIVELEQATDLAQKQRRAEFITSLEPVYVNDMIVLQRYEIRSFVWLYYFYAGLYPYGAFTPSFSRYLFENFDITVRDDYAITDYFRNARRRHLVPIIKGQDEMVLALQTLQTVDRRRLAEVEEETFALHLAGVLPKFAPSGAPVDQGTQRAMIKLCWERRATLRRLSPAIFVEEELGVRRRENATRRPSRADGADLMHCTVALAYCNVFITNDRFAFRCCEHAKAVLARENVPTAELFRSLQDFVSAHR
jgi:hypothetical protein